MKSYRNKDGRILFVGRGIGIQDSYMTFYRRSAYAKRRFRSLRLPVRETFEEAQADLDAYARKYELEEVEETTINTTTN